MSKSINSTQAQWEGRRYRVEVWSVLCLLVIAFIWTCVGGRAWDADALVVERARLDATSQMSNPLSKELKDTQTVFLEVEIKNKTGRDIVLPPSIKLRETTKFSPSLKFTEFGLNGPVILRAGGTTNVRISYDLYCKVGRMRKDCVRRALGDIDQLIMFDGAHEYEIRVPLADAIDTYLTSPN